MEIEEISDTFHRMVHGTRTAITAKYNHYYTLKAAIKSMGERDILKLLNTALRLRAINRATVQAGRKK